MEKRTSFKSMVRNIRAGKYGIYTARSEKGKKHLENLFETAIETSDLELAKHCIKKGVDPNAFLVKRDAALHILAEKGDGNLGELLLTCKGINVNVQNDQGNTALHIASIYQKRRFALLLLAYDANPNIRNHAEKVPLHFAAKHKAIFVVYDLVRYGARANVADIYGSTPLSISVIDNPSILIARTLLKNGANPNLTTLSPQPLLLEAVLNCNDDQRLDMIELLVNNGVDVNIAHPVSKMTALHMVAVTGYLPVAKLLLEHGASLEMKDVAGRTAIGVAIDHGREDLVNLYQDFKKNYYHSILKKQEDLKLSKGVSFNRPSMQP